MLALKSDHEAQLVELMEENESKHMECVRLRTGKIPQFTIKVALVCWDCS